MAWYWGFYCACGSYVKASGWGFPFESYVAEFQEKHVGDGHYQVEPAECATARRKHQRANSVPAPAAAIRRTPASGSRVGR